MDKRKVKKVIYLTLSCIVIVGLLVTFCCYGNHAAELLACLKTLKPSVLLLLIPTVWLMYDAAGRIWYPFLREDGLSVRLLARIQYEMCFMNTMLPFLDMISSKVYAERRLGNLGISKERAGGLHTYRYWVSVFTKWLEILIVMYFLARIGVQSKPAVAVRYLIAGVAFLILCAFVAGYTLLKIAFMKLPDASKEQMSKHTFGLSNVAASVMDNCKGMLESIFWGGMYSFLEVAPYLVVAIAIGRVELFWPIMAASGIGVIAGGVTFTPLGAGTSEAAIALLVWGMGYDLIPTVVILIVSRILMTIGTGVTGFYVWLPSARELTRKR